VPSLSDTIRQKRVLWLLPFVLVPLFWLASRWNASHGAGFRFARDKIEDSTALQARIGKVSDVSFPIFSHYSAHYGVGYSKIHMELKAKGDRGIANVQIDIAEDDVGSWKIERSTVDGHSMTLDR
jgi:hypothetical protein